MAPALVAVEGQPIVLKQAVEHTPGKRPVAAATLERQIHDLLHDKPKGLERALRGSGVHGPGASNVFRIACAVQARKCGR